MKKDLMQLSRRAVFLAVMLCGFILQTSCGGDPGQQAVSPPPVLPPAPPPPAPYIPGTGVLVIDQPALSASTQANQATATIVLDSGVPVAQFTTPATSAQPAGAFVGGGTGNKGIIGFDGFDGLRLLDLSTVEIDAKQISGTPGNFYMNFVVDVDCVKNRDLSLLTLAQLRAFRRIVVWIPSASTPLPNGYTRYSATSADAAWLIVGTPNLGIGANPSGPATALTAWTGNSAACLVDGVSGDGGLPRNVAIPACVTGAALPGTASAQCGLPTKSALLLLGDSNNLVAKQWNVKRLKIKDREIIFQ